MKRFTTTFQLFTLLLLFSCSRAVNNNSRVHLVLPVSVQNSSSATDINSVLGITGGIPLFYPEANQFNFITPIDSAGSSAPVNCYLVTVSVFTDSSDPSHLQDSGFFHTNSCGNYTLANALNPDSGVYTSGYSFGPFVGLFNQATAAAGVTLDLPSGSDRVFTLWGFNANSPSDCTSLSGGINKSKLSKPYKIAESAPTKLEPSINAEVDLTSLPIDANTLHFDDCKTTVDPVSFPVADTVKINQDNFPYDYVAAEYVTTMVSHDKCAPVEIDLIKNLTTSVTVYSAEVPAALPLDTVFELVLSANGSAIPTPGPATAVPVYLNESDCYQSIHASSTFTIPANTQHVKKWYQPKVGKLYDGTQPNHLGKFNLTPFVVTSVNAVTLTSQTATFTWITDDPALSGDPAPVLLDTVFPKVMQMGRCYAVTTFLRDIHGALVSGSGTLHPHNNDGNFTATYVGFYNSDSCKNSFTAGSVQNIPFTGTSVTYFVNSLLTGKSSFNMPAVMTIPSTVPTVAPLTKYIAVNSLAGTANIDISYVGFARAYLKAGLINNTANCSPLFVSLTDKNGVDIAAGGPTTGSTSNIRGPLYPTNPATALRSTPLRVGSGDSAVAPVPSSFQIFSDSNCSTSRVYLVGDTAAFPGGEGTPVTIAASNGTTFVQLYIKPTGVPDTGSKKHTLRFFFDGDSSTSATVVGYPVGQAEFELTDPSH